MKRKRIHITDITSAANLTDAAYKAAKGKRNRPAVKAFFREFDTNIHRLGKKIEAFDLPCSPLKRFIIHDPKKRIIHAPGFEDRIIHHAIINFVGPVLDGAMVDYTFACRTGKGVHAAVRTVQKNSRQYKWYVKIDIKHYFDGIDHPQLEKLLESRFKGDRFLKLIRILISGYRTDPGKGLPIGALPSQHFANFFLDRLDRYIMEYLHAKACVRYMDDVIWWCDTKIDAMEVLRGVKNFISDQLLLQIKEDQIQVNKTNYGVSFCGYRVFPGRIRLSSRKKKRYTAFRKKWENLYMTGGIDEKTLMSAYDAVFSITAHADSREWRKQQLKRSPPPMV